MFTQKVKHGVYNKLFNEPTIQDMQESMVLLYKVAAEKRRVTTPSAVGRVMGVSQQRLKNWEARGISKDGALLAQELFGIDSNALLKLNSTPKPQKHTSNERIIHQDSYPHRVEQPRAEYQPTRWPFKTITAEQWEALTKTQKSAVETVARSYVTAREEDSTPHTPMPAPNAAAA